MVSSFVFAVGAVGGEFVDDDVVSDVGAGDGDFVCVFSGLPLGFLRYVSVEDLCEELVEFLYVMPIDFMFYRVVEADFELSCWRDPHHERGVVFGFDFDGLLDAHSVHPLSAPSAWAQSQEMPALLLCAMQVTRRLSGMVIVQVSHWAL